MKRIPYPGNKDGVYGNLVEASRDMLAQFGKEPLAFPSRFPRNLSDVELMIDASTAGFPRRRRRSSHSTSNTSVPGSIRGPTTRPTSHCP